MPTYTSPRPVADHATWAPGTSCPMATRDLYNFPIAASTPHDWYRPRIFVSGCENPANAGSGSSSTGGGSFLYDPAADAWEDIPHFIGMDPDYSTAGVFSHGAATFHPTGPTGTATAGSASGITIDNYLAGNVAVGATIRITGGTGAGQSRTITAVSDTETYTDYIAPVFKGMTTASSASASSLVANKPALCVDGDMLVAVVFINNQILPNSVPAGWTLQDGPRGGSATGGAIYTKVASGEPASWTWGWASSGEVHVYTFCYSGTDAIDTATGGGTGAVGDGTAVPSMTVARNNSAVVVGAYNGWSGLALPNPLPVPMNFAPTPPSNKTAAVSGNLNAGTSQPIAFGRNSDGRTGTSAVVLRPSVQGTLTRTRRQANAPTVVNRTSGEATITLTLSVPPGTLDGDLMVATVALASGQGSTAPTPPAGWSGSDYVGTYGTVSVYSRTASSEPASYTWTSTTTMWGRIITFRNATEGGVFVTGQGVSTTITSQVPVTTPGARILHHAWTGATYTSPNTPFSAIDQSGPWTALTDGRLFGGLSEPLTPSYGRNPVSLSYTCGPNGDEVVYTVILPTQSPSGTTALTVDSPWSVQPDNTSTYAIDSGSFWCWRGNASDSTWVWSKYDIARGVWEQKTSTDSVAAPTYIGSTVNVDSTYDASTTVSVPAGTANGDLMIAALTTGQGGATAPAGWTLLGYANSGGGTCSTMYVFYRIASSEPASYSFPRDGATSGCVATCVTYRGAGIPTLVIANGDNVPRASVTYAIPNVFQLPAVVASFVQNRADEPYPGQWFCQPISVSDTYRNGSTNSRFGDQVFSASAASGATSFSWFIDPYNTGSKVSWMAWGSVLIPAATPGMSNYGKADPTRQGGIHAVTDDSDYIWLGGDAQTSLRRYSISGDSWSASAEHTPYTRPMRNIGGGMVMVKDLPGWADNGRYIFYVCPTEQQNVYDNVARVYAYDTQNNVWIDLFAAASTGLGPGQFCQVGSVNGRLVWNTPASRKVYVHRPDRIDALLPDAMLNAPVRGGTTTGCSLHPITLGGEPYLYMLEHSNTQEIIPFRARLRGITWAGG